MAEMERNHSSSEMTPGGNNDRNPDVEIVEEVWNGYSFINYGMETNYISNYLSKMYNMETILNTETEPEDRKMARIAVNPFECADTMESALADFQTHSCRPSNEMKHFCQFCETSFRLESEYNRHFLIKKIPYKYKYNCDRCGQKFLTKKGLAGHYRTRTEKKGYKCYACEEKFPNRKTLKLHKITHTGKKPYKCDICMTRFNHIKRLTRHKTYRHNSSKQFWCGKCHKGLNNYRSLIQHKTRHRKRHLCETCGKRFKSISLLAVHKLTHITLERPFICNICEKGFSSPGSLGTHRALHNGGKFYKCDLCSNHYSQTLSAVQKHKIKNHPPTSATSEKF